MKRLALPLACILLGAMATAGGLWLWTEKGARWVEDKFQEGIRAPSPDPLEVLAEEAGL